MTKPSFSAPVLRALLGLAFAALGAHAALAQDMNLLRKNLAERMPQLKQIDEITKTPMPGIYELRVGTDVFYSDEQGNYVIQGEIFDTKAKLNLTQARIDKLTAINFATLPLKDAVVWKSGNGKRKVAIFADPNCGYCKHFEHTLQDVKDVTVYTFIIPILGGDSPQKARDIWCSKDVTSTWRNWMLNGQMPARSMGTCDTSAIDRNLAAAQHYKVTGTPAIVFEDGTRVPGILPIEEVEKHFTQAAAATGRSPTKG